MVRCELCGQQWPRDPALEVACPICLAPAGVKCRRPSGHPCDLHAARDRRALDLGLINPCPAAQRKPDNERHIQQRFAF